MNVVTVTPIETSSERLLTVQGLVAPSGWDLDDQVSEVTIYTKSEEEYIVNTRPTVKQLMKYFDDEVEVTGYLSEDEYGTSVLIVSDLKPLTNIDSDEDEDEDEDDWDDDWDDDDDDDDADWDNENEEGLSWKRFQDR